MSLLLLFRPRVSGPIPVDPADWPPEVCDDITLSAEPCVALAFDPEGRDSLTFTAE